MNCQTRDRAGVPQVSVQSVQNVRTVHRSEEAGPSRRPALRRVAAALAFVTAIGAAAPAAGQVCSYPTLVDDTPQAFATNPTIPRFAQSGARWAAVAVKSAGTANWDIGLSLNSAPFAACITLPVVASQQASGVDFVLGDFAAEGTGTRYAPISRTSGTGSATVEWDSGSRTAGVGPVFNQGQSPAGLIDCWNVDLVAGTSYKIWLWGDVPGDFRLYAFKGGGLDSWRSRADALIEVVSSFSGPPILTATTTDRYALVVVNETGTTLPYYFTVQPCVDPPDLAAHVSQPIPAGAGHPETPFQFEVGSTGFPTIAVRTAQAGDNFDLGVYRRVGGGFYPCDGAYQASSGDYGPRVDLLVGDRVSVAVSTGGTYWAGAQQGGLHALDGRIEYSPGTDAVAVDGATQYVVGGNDLVVRTFRTDLIAGTEVRIHVAKCGPSPGRLRIFRPFDMSQPFGNGWSGLSGDHLPLTTVDLTGVNDFNFNPPVSGAYALVLTNETAENVCWELGVSSCRARTELADGVPLTMASGVAVPYEGEAFATLHGRFGWSAVAVLPAAITEDWVIEAWDAPSGGGGGAPFGCNAGLLGASNDVGISSRIDFLARYDLPVPPFQEWVETVRVYPAAGLSLGGGGQAEFEMHNTTLAVGDFVNAFPLSPFDYMEVWNIELVGGQPYAVHFQTVGFTGDLFIMKSVLASTSTCTFDCPPEYLALGGPGQVLRTSGPTVFTPPESGVYGLIVLHQRSAVNTVYGSFSLAVNPTIVGVGPPPPPPAVTRFRAAAPNPLRGTGTQLAFELAKEAPVSFEIMNIAGRVVARVPERTYAAGPGQVAWDARTPDGGRLPPGLYFVRMRVAGAIVGGGKLIAM